MSDDNNESGNSDVICLDSSEKSTDGDKLEEEEGEVSDEVIICDKSVCFNETLPPGIAPEGFIIIDEAIEVVKNTGEISSEPEDGTQAPILKVTFRDEGVARKYKGKIQDFLTQLIFGEATEDRNASKPTLAIWPSRDSKNRIIPENNFYMIDNNPDSQESLDIPTYGKKFERVLNDVSDPPAADEKGKTTSKLNCFNCLGSHNLRDCPEPRNVLEINKNRKEFNSRNGPRSVRYHVEEDAKFDHFKPGVLSPELRKALGLADDELPRHIYKMRILGYPPGWLEDARLQHSGINLYNSEGMRETEPDEEQGEIFTPESRDKYDIRKVHDFPGFNIPAPPGILDAGWNVEQRKIHSKDTMLAKMNGRKAEEGYKRKKMKQSEAVHNSRTIENAQMEIEIIEDAPIESLDESGYFVPPIPKEPEPCQRHRSPPPIAPLEEETSPTELRSTGASSSPTESENRQQKLCDSVKNTHSELSAGTTSIYYSNMLAISDQRDRIGRVTSVDLGTPILQSTSPFTKLPASANFSKDICEVINFENLPNSTGKYKKMTEILQKVRGTLSHAP
uniref:CG4622_0 protein n=1 Tax=Fopius arisanus TaxID=64838 RepID=A0A0C9PS02_9HYME